MKAALAILALLCASAAPARPAAPQPIRIWGPPAMRAIVERWADVYRKTHPGVTFELTLKGSDTAIPGLYGGGADIALMGRANDIVDDNGFSRAMERNFTHIEIANGAVAAPGKSDAIALLVHADNPLKRLTLAQLDATINCGRGNVARTWGQLGLTGAWANKPIHIYSYDLASRTGMYLQQVVSNNSRRMCWDRISEFGDARRLDGTVAAAADRIGAAARHDRYALAIANPAQATEGLRLVALGAGDAAVLPTAETIVTRRYPLARRVHAFVDHKPGTALDPRVAAFLHYVLSREGQALLALDRGYLPLDAATASTQMAILGEIR